MSSRLVWHGNEASMMIRRKVVQALSRAAQTVSTRARELLSVSGTGRRMASGAIVRARKSAKNRVYGAFPSAPGEPPHKQTGRLHMSVTYEIDESELKARVGTNVPYGKFLELGTKRGLAPRPWLRRALAESAARISMIMAGLSGG